MQTGLLLAIPAAALFVACGASPNGPTSPLVSRGAATSVNSASFRVVGQPNGTSWTINSPIPEPLGVAQGATVASGDGSRLYHIGGGYGGKTPTDRGRGYPPG